MISFTPMPRSTGGEGLALQVTLLLVGLFVVPLTIFKGMEFLHSITPPLIHRDLKSPNVLVGCRIVGDLTSSKLTSTKGHIAAKVADFGLSSKLFITAFKEKHQERTVGNPT